MAKTAWNFYWCIEWFTDGFNLFNLTLTQCILKLRATKKKKKLLRPLHIDDAVIHLPYCVSQRPKGIFLFIISMPIVLKTTTAITKKECCCAHFSAINKIGASIFSEPFACDMIRAWQTDWISSIQHWLWLLSVLKRTQRYWAIWYQCCHYCQCFHSRHIIKSISVARIFPFFSYFQFNSFRIYIT